MEWHLREEKKKEKLYDKNIIVYQARIVQRRKDKREEERTRREKNEKGIKSTSKTAQETDADTVDQSQTVLLPWFQPRDIYITRVEER